MTFFVLAPLGGGGLGTTYDDHLRLIGKHVYRGLHISVN